MSADGWPHDVEPAIWTREGVNRFARADGAAIYGIGRGQWCATVPSTVGTTKVTAHVGTKRGSARKFPSAGAAARFLALHHHPRKGSSHE